MTKLNFEIRQISGEETITLRQKILRPNFTEKQCVYPGDDKATALHQGLFVSGKLVVISTFHAESFAKFPAKNPYRLRGMATDREFQGQGLGFELLNKGIESLQERDCDLLWFNAREKAFPFYEKLGFQYEGPLFEIDDIGPHKVMYKYLIPR